MEEDSNLHITLIEAELGDVPLAQSKKLTPPSVVSEAYFNLLCRFSGVFDLNILRCLFQ